MNPISFESFPQTDLCYFTNTNDYITNFDFAAYTEYCDTPNSGVMTGNYTGPIRGNDGNVVGCGGWPTPVETTGLDCAIFVR